MMEHSLNQPMHKCQDSDTDLSELQTLLDSACSARDAYHETAAMANQLVKPRGGKKKKAQCANSLDRSIYWSYVFICWFWFSICTRRSAKSKESLDPKTTSIITFTISSQPHPKILPCTQADGDDDADAWSAAVDVFSIVTWVYIGSRGFWSSSDMMDDRVA